MEKRVFSYFLFNKINKNSLKEQSNGEYLSLFHKIYSNFTNIKDILKIDFKVYLYKIFPMSYNVDFMVWLAFDFENENILSLANDEIFKVYLDMGDSFELVDVLWGFTKPSIYSKATKSTQEINPFSNNRKKFLTVYPFVKTSEWYLLKQDTRQGMMNEHIRIGRQYLSNNEFVVVYEMDSIVLFEKLVYDLRQSEARKYTLRDTPIYTGIYLDMNL